MLRASTAAHPAAVAASMRPTVRSAVGAAALLVGLALTAPDASGQEGCVLGDRGRNDTFIQTLPGIGTVTYIGGAYFSCDGGVQIFADSAVAYQQRGMSELLGSVRYIEADRELRAARAQYFTNEGRLQAQGDVIVVDRTNGSSIRDGDLVYLLQTDFRDVSEMTVTIGTDGVRPSAVLTPPVDTAQVDSLGVPVPVDATPPEPYAVDADRIYIRGSGYFAASGDVVIERDSLVAFADSAEYDDGAEGLNLVDNARVVGTAYELTGRVITMTNPGGEASEVRALREARLVGTDVLLTAARIVVLLNDGALDRLVATTLAPQGGEEPDSVDLERPEALVEEFVLTADSLTVLAPAERVQRVVASGAARSVSSARDSLNTEVLPEVARKDWLEGDTVIIRFVGSPPLPPMGGETAIIIAPDSVGVGIDADSTTVDVTAAGSATAVADTATAAADVTGAVVVEATTADPADAMELPPSEPVSADSAATDTDVEEIIARGRARSLYRLPPNDSTYRAGTDPPAVHYVMGQEIRIRLQDGGVEGMQVTGQTRGVHLEPLRRMVVPDSAVADTAAARDTIGVVESRAVEAAPGGAAPGVSGITASPDRSSLPEERNERSRFIRLEKEYPWTRP